MIPFASLLRAIFMLNFANYSVVALQCHIACLSIRVYIVTVRLKSSVICYDHIGAGIWGAREKQ